jgi:hypothetical protein
VKKRMKSTILHKGDYQYLDPQQVSSQSGGHNPRLRMVNQDTTLRLPMFHGMGKDDAEKHWFMCEAIWSVKRIIDKASKIAQLETTFRDRALMWYMKYKETMHSGTDEVPDRN